MLYKNKYEENLHSARFYLERYSKQDNGSYDLQEGAKYLFKCLGEYAKIDACTEQYKKIFSKYLLMLVEILETKEDKL